MSELPSTQKHHLHPKIHQQKKLMKTIDLFRTNTQASYLYVKTLGKPFANPWFHPSSNRTDRGDLGFGRDGFRDLWI